MEITGCDLVFFTCRQPHEVYRRVCACVLKRWPTALVESLSGPVPLASFLDQPVPAEAGSLLFYRDTAMFEQWTRRP